MAAGGPSQYKDAVLQQSRYVLWNRKLNQDMYRIDGLMQKRRNSSALAMELHLFCIKPSVCNVIYFT